MTSMYVVKRSGRHEPVSFDKILGRVRKLCYGLNDTFVDPVVVAQKVCQGVYRGVTTAELDELAAETAAHLVTEHPDYGTLGARIAVSNLHKGTERKFSAVFARLAAYAEPATGEPAPLVSAPCAAFVRAHAAELDAAIVYSRDLEYDYFGFKTLARAYLLRLDGRIVERPQHLLMRVAVGLHCGDLPAVLETYELLSGRWFTHASPTLFNAAAPAPQLSSCFLLQMQADSIEGIYDTLKMSAQISKQAGGIGLALHKIRATGSYIRGTNGTSNGLVPMLRVFDATARYVDQGGGKRKGAFAVYLEPWHADVEAWLDLRKNHGAEEYRARDLFYGLWTPDLFMERVQADGVWSLMCPQQSPGLAEVHSAAFVELYEAYEREGRFVKQVPARQLWQKILDAQQETGQPYMLFKDAANAKSNQQNLGTIQCSNLCTEIIQYTSPDEVAVCNLASLALPRFVDHKKGVFDHARLHEVTQVVARNLDRIIDINFYAVPEAERSNLRHRPMGLGVQGLADVFALLGLPFTSPRARQLNREIFETLYHAALTASCALARRDGAYASFAGSPASAGLLQFDLWGVTPGERWDWAALKADIAAHGLRNSLLVAPMPTASTAQILGNNECFEPFTSNVYVRRTLAGEFVCVNKHLVRDLAARGLWTRELKEQLVAHRGSVQGLAGVPADLQALYKTVWELSAKDLLEMAADRGAFVDQSQSLNVHMAEVTPAKLTSMHFHAWRRGLKTGMYYLRSRPAAEPIQFTVDHKTAAAARSPAREPEPSPAHPPRTLPTLVLAPAPPVAGPVAALPVVEEPACTACSG